MTDRAVQGALLRDTGLSPEMLEQMQAEPWQFGFLSLMRRLGANPDLAPIGLAQRPRAEPFRLGQQPSLTFAPREIACISEREGRLLVRLFSLGMLGPNGALPIHFTEVAREREESRRDATLVRFLDLFHHRYLTLFYRAWASAQATAGLDRPGPENERFSFYIASLYGQDPVELSQRVLPAHAQLAASPHLVREARNPDGLRQTLEHYFGVPVAIHEYAFHWIEVDPDDLSYMARPGDASTMGSAMLGERVPDRQYRFRIVIGPLDIEEYLRFTPRGRDLPRLVDWVRTFVGCEFDWELELRIRAHSAPPAIMSGAQQLGWSTWLGNSPDEQPVTGMKFEPERYVDQFVTTNVADTGSDGTTRLKDASYFETTPLKEQDGA
ncbi:type VI secretion system baseplate subunit TssG [Paraburkholderia tropica]|uniref:type VI secretion system baseplate subunit TssG n=1 Tax=Paraburkholderia tropica TaxID=92647 RepID=UPI001601E855|nr:type VI secretion system baseplate subunit TssG [Paraburkholderia tropica]QNB14644.1 type VI secretion system baseplate subunit TssG [Paraburkholderia tropica]